MTEFGEGIARGLDVVFNREARGRMNSVLVEFADGFRVITSRHAVRKTA